jgi:hypothetical protein
MSAERAHPKPLTDEEIDEAVIAEADDSDAWEESIRVTPTRLRQPSNADSSESKNREDHR